jgi:hypothetical protein
MQASAVAGDTPARTADRDARSLRAFACRGELRIESPPGDGTMIAATTQIPTSKAA